MPNQPYIGQHQQAMSVMDDAMYIPARMNLEFFEGVQVKTM
jgi:hypothetical protein